MQLTKQKLVDQLLRQVYSEDSPYALKDPNGTTVLALHFALADTKQIFLLAHEILNEHNITLYTLDPTLFIESGDDVGPGLEVAELVIVEDNQKKEKAMVDSEQWFCSCSTFVARFDATGTTSSHTVTDVKYGHRDHPKIQFHLNVEEDPSSGRVKEDAVPICEHLLAVFLCELHPHKLHQCIAIRHATQQELLEVVKLL